MTPLWLMLACAAPPVDDHGDRDLYLEAATAAPTEAVSRCEQITDPALRGQCTVEVIPELARLDPDRAHQACEATPPGLWIEECWFTLSDALELDTAGAQALCGLAGRFAEECLAHAVTRELLAWTELPAQVGAEVQLGEVALAEAQRHLGDSRAAAHTRDAVLVEVLVARLEVDPLGDATCGAADPALCARAWLLLLDRRQLDLRELCGGPAVSTLLVAEGGPGFEMSWANTLRRAWDQECSRWL